MINKRSTRKKLVEIRPILEMGGVELDIDDETMSIYQALTPHQKIVACYYLMGMNNIEIYDTVYKDNSKKLATTQRKKTQCIWSIRRRIKKFLDACDKIKFNAAIMTREQILAELSQNAQISLADIFDLQTGQLKPTATKQQMDAVTSMTVGARSVTYKTDKMDCLKLLVDILGLKQPQQLEVSGNLTQNIARKQITDASMSLKQEFGDLD